MGKDLVMLIAFGVVLLVIGVYYIYDKIKNNNAKGNNVGKTSGVDKVSGVKKVDKAVEQKDMSGFIKFDKIANDMIYQNNNNINATMCLLEESIKLCPRNPRAFLLLGYITKEQKYVVLAKKSVDVILCDGKIKKLCISDLVDPEFFINEHVKGLYMSEFTYNAL